MSEGSSSGNNSISGIACLQLEEKSTAGPSAIGDNLDRRVAMFLQLLYFVAAAKVVVAATETVIAATEVVGAVVICCCYCCKLLLLLLRMAAAAWLTGSHKRRRRGGTSVGGAARHTKGEEEKRGNRNQNRTKHAKWDKFQISSFSSSSQQTTYKPLIGC